VLLAPAARALALLYRAWWITRIDEDSAMAPGG